MRCYAQRWGRMALQQAACHRMCRRRGESNRTQGCSCRSCMCAKGTHAPKLVPLHTSAHTLHSSIRLHLQERIGVLESTLRAEREERHAERLAEARRAEALQRRVDTLAGEAEAANKDPVSPTAAGCGWLGSAGRFSHRSVIHEMHVDTMLNLGQRWAVGPSGRLRRQWRAQACAALRGIGDDFARLEAQYGTSVTQHTHTTFTRHAT